MIHWKRKYKTIVTLLMLTLLTVSLSGCGMLSKWMKPSELGAGKTENGTYSNDYFGLKMTLPENWTEMNDEAKKVMIETGKQIVTNGDATKKSAVEQSEKRTMVLVGMTRLPLGSPAPSNAQFVAMAEKVSAFPGVKSGKDYLANALKLMNGVQSPFKFKEGQPEKIGGVDFDVIEAKLQTQGGQSVTIRMYAAVIRDYALIFNTTYMNEEDHATMQKALDSAKFDL